MAKKVLPTNFIDDELNSSMHGTRQYKITRTDGSSEIVTIEDVSEYNVVGSEFGADQINQTNVAVNASADAGKIIDSLDIIKATTKEGYIGGALAIKELYSQLNSKLGTAFPKNKLLPFSGTFQFDANGETTITFAYELEHKYIAVLNANSIQMSIKSASTTQAVLVCEAFKNKSAYIAGLIFCVY